jgi:hypothetical protein
MRAADEERQRTGTGGGNKRRPGNSGEDAAWWTKEVRAAGCWAVVAVSLVVAAVLCVPDSLNFRSPC